MLRRIGARLLMSWSYLLSLVGAGILGRMFLERKGLSRGKHQILMTGATTDHDLVAATHTITIDVQ
jgi:hypothetical protein